MQAVEALQGAGIPVILLKGAAIAAWLYPSELRDYRDVDLLVAPADRDRAQAVLARLGYRHTLLGASPAEYGPNEIDLVRADGLCIDLHHTLIGSPAGRCWPALHRRVTRLPVAGHDLPVLDIPARAMHLALHAAQNGLADQRAAEDLRRGLALLDEDTWRAASAVAAEAGATQAFAAALHLTAPGRTLATRLAVAPPTAREARLRAASAGPRALALQRLLDTPGATARLRFAARKLWPTPARIRHRHPAAASLLRHRLLRLASAPLLGYRAVTERARARARGEA